MRVSRIVLTGLIIVVMAVPAMAKKIPVFVSIIPQQYFVERIGGEHVDVQVMVKPGASPATYEPKPRQMAALSKAELYFSIGVPFENAWMERIAAANPNMKVIPMDKGFKKLPMAEHHHHEGEHEGHHEGETAEEHAAHSKHEEHHDHEKHDDHDGHEHKAAHAKHEDHEEHHDHGDHDDHAGHEEHHDHEDGLDPHVWLSPMLVKEMAVNIKRALVKADPEHAKDFRKNLRELKKEIEALDIELNNMFADIPEEKRKFMVFHPSWGYFAMNYQLVQIPIEYQGKEPSPKMLSKLMEEAQEENIRTIFVQPQFSQKSAKAIARHIGAEVVIADPLAKDWDANLRRVAAGFVKAFNKTK